MFIHYADHLRTFPGPWHLRMKGATRLQHSNSAKLTHEEKCVGACADAKHYLPIHREAPPYVDQSTEQEILVTGIKVLFLSGTFFACCLLRCINSASAHLSHTLICHCALFNDSDM